MWPLLRVKGLTLKTIMVGLDIGGHECVGKFECVLGRKNQCVIIHPIGQNKLLILSLSTCDLN